MAAASALLAGYASAELEGEVHVGYSSIYEFRFVDFGSDLVEAGADISYDTGFVGLSAGAWYGSVDDSFYSFNELDLYAAVSKELGPVNLELGYIYYGFDAPGTTDTQEVYLSATYNLPWDIALGATYYYDFDAANGWYLQPELSKSFKFNDCLALNLSAGVGIADGLGGQPRAANTPALVGVGRTADGFQGYYVKAELPWEFRENVTIAPYVKYTDADSKLAADIGSRLRGGQDHLIGGVKLTVGF
ncbi:hypothetical protein [Luteolibacter sp. Populi]|uniref:hypothetical protein n=1 Tax=Luteolibacter sp. Populi TaxID=3230487 RepID=UPI00346760B1